MPVKAEVQPPRAFPAVREDSVRKALLPPSPPSPPCSPRQGEAGLGQVRCFPLQSNPEVADTPVPSGALCTPTLPVSAEGPGAVTVITKLLDSQVPPTWEEAPMLPRGPCGWGEGAAGASAAPWRTRTRMRLDVTVGQTCSVCVMYVCMYVCTGYMCYAHVHI